MFLRSSHMLTKVRRGMEFASFLKLSYFQSFNWVSCVLRKDNAVPFHPWQREMEKKWKRESVCMATSELGKNGISQSARTYTHITSTELKKTSQSDSLWHIRGVWYRVVEVCGCLCVCVCVYDHQILPRLSLIMVHVTPQPREIKASLKGKTQNMSVPNPSKPHQCLLST